MGMTSYPGNIILPVFIFYHTTVFAVNPALKNTAIRKCHIISISTKDRETGKADLCLNEFPHSQFFSDILYPQRI